MIFAPIDVSLQANPKAIRAGTAMYLWLYSMLWSRDQKESGRVPAHVLMTCPWGSRRDNALACKRLLASGLFVPAEEATSGDRDDVCIRNYEKKNDTREVIEKRIEGNRVRQADFKAKRRSANVEVTRYRGTSLGSDSGCDSVLASKKSGDINSGVAEGEPVESPRDRLTVGSSGCYAAEEAFAEAVVAETQAAYSIPSFSDRELTKAINALCPTAYGLRRMRAWVVLNVGNFVRAQLGERNPNLRPSAWAAWMGVPGNAVSLEQHNRTQARRAAEPDLDAPLEPPPMTNAEIATAAERAAAAVDAPFDPERPSGVIAAAYRKAASGA